MSFLHTKRNMQLIRHLDLPSDSATAVAIGNFDGLHLGHQSVIRTMLRETHGCHPEQREGSHLNGILRVAQDDSVLAPSVLTFEPHPRRYFAPTAPLFRLESLSQKLHRLSEWGVARVYMPRFDATFASQSAEEFLEKVLQKQLRAKVVVTGDNFAFGKGRGGNAALLRAWGAAQDVTIHTLPAVKIGDTVCSSSAVRDALSRGDVGQAAALLGHSYRIAGRVLHGDARGRQLGFPTANVALPVGLKLPAYGVYAVKVGAHHAIANLGVRPSIDATNKPTLEVHLFDFDGDLYGTRLKVDFVQYIRPEMKFDSLDALKAQIAKDCAAARRAL